VVLEATHAVGGMARTESYKGYRFDIGGHRFFTKVPAVSEMWPNASTIAAGLRVPKAYGDYLMLEILRKSGGVALSVTDDEIMDALQHWARVEGIFAAPEGAASLAAYRKLRSNGYFSSDDRVVLFNTGTALKYLDVIQAYNKKQAPRDLPAARAIGGIIGPY